MNSDCGPYKLSGKQRVAQIVAKPVEPTTSAAAIQQRAKTRYPLVGSYYRRGLRLLQEGACCSYPVALYGTSCARKKPDWR